ncbi:MAG TPA: Ig-like domain-containing protein, partial [Verrucomicrobiae bacterium]|nr:Ig-like domain-containing protein [Verrucomicrobiae bacterium]
TIAELTTLTVTNNAMDADLPANELTYTLLDAPGDATISSEGVINWTPGETEGSTTNLITTVVSDGTLSVTNQFEVVVEEVNVAPVFVSVPTNRTIAELTTLTVTNNASDADLPANTLTYTLLDAPGDATISSEGVITWTPGEAEGPTTNVIVTVVSDGTLSVTNEFEVVVEEVNVASAFVSVPTNTTIAELTTLTVTNNATDADLPANTLTYTLLDAPGSATISSEGVITWTPSEAEGPTTNVITTVVSDGILSATNSFVVIVLETDTAPVAVNDAYAVMDAFLTVAASGVLANDSDADIPNNTLMAVLVSNPTNGVLSLEANGGFTYTPNSGFSGVDAFTYRAHDGLLNSEVAMVTFTVTSPIFSITSVTVSNQVATIQWESVPSRTYRLEYKEALTETSWTPVVPEVTATGSTTSTTNFIGTAEQRYYRVNRLP